ncbi:MAG: hypothetical protein ACT4N2_07970 [Hyphomicrobium sp.]
MRRWLGTLLGRRRSGPIPTADYYFLGALGDLVDETGAGHRPIVQLGPHTFACQDRLVVIRYATDAELAAIERRRWREVFYVIDDVLPIAAKCLELPEDYRLRLARFVGGQLPRILALDPVVVAPSDAILALFPGRPTVMLAPCTLACSADLDHFDRPIRAHTPLKIAFLGTRSHGAGMEFLTAILRTTLKAGNNRRCTMFFGRHLPEELGQLPGLDNRPALDWPKFRAFLTHERFHILLAPLPDTPFNRGRSITKLLDAAAIGACGLFSDRPPFRGPVMHGETGILLDDDAALWSREIDRLERAPGTMRSIAEHGAMLAAKLGDPARVRAFWCDRLGI